MNLWFRLLHLLLCSLFRPKLEAPFGVSRLQFRVLPNDLDSNLHMTNGRYWNIFDLGRLDLILRMGLGRVALREKWAPIVGAGTIQFRRELKPFQRFTLETRLVGWIGSRGIMEQRSSDRARAEDRHPCAAGHRHLRPPRAPVPGHAEDDGSDRRGCPAVAVAQCSRRGVAGGRCRVEAGRCLSFRWPLSAWGDFPRDAGGPR